MKIAFYIAKRYAFSKSKSKAINVITAIASIGIVVSAMAMLIVLAVFSGLRSFSLSFTNELDPELKAFSKHGKNFVVNPTQYQELSQSDLFSGVARIVEDRLLFTYNEKQTVAILKGVDADFPKVSQFPEKVELGHWIEPGSDEVVTGLGMAYLLSMGLFDIEHNLQALSIKPGSGVVSNPEDAFLRTYLHPVGIYSLRNEELDSKYVFCAIELAQHLLSLEENEYTNLEFALNPGVTEKEASAFIEQVLGDTVVIKNRIQLNDSLYRMLNTENAVVYFIFLLVVIIALFNLVGALLMIILEKKANIKTLNDLGVPLKQLKRIFLFQGLIISTVGGLIGIALGIIGVLIQEHFGLILIRPGFAYPVEFNIGDVFVVFGSIFILGFIASYIASTRVNKKYLHA
ncbi:ABC transporter permease [Myroides fluvii]|uniref:ABC transporter permease n=1 Tax=Myroides fluvii TaxID=2572594 RepID=UPI00131B9BA2|nr:FtsX-like permease family protein [Myroides fluvii]